MTKEEFKSRNTITGELERRGFKVPNQRKGVTRCPFHEDKSPSFSFDNEKGLWNCHAQCGGGDIFDLLARFDGGSATDAIKKHVPLGCEPPVASMGQKPVLEKIYSYTDENGNELYQALRYKPKTFRQRHKHNGDWVWNMEGVGRVLYHLPEVARAECVWIVEGEKDAENLRELGYVATCNVGGAGKWLDGYTETLKGKEVVLCGDTDKAGIEHMEKVITSISSSAKSVRKISLPGDFKDVSDYIAAFAVKSEAQVALDGLKNSAIVLIKGMHIPVFSLWELEDQYRDHLKNLTSNQFNIGNWIPTLGRHVRGLVPGEMVTIIASTGVGKTAILQNVAKATAPLPTILFEMELPPELVYERFIGIQSGWSYKQVESAFHEAIELNAKLGEDGVSRLSHVYVCTEPRLTPEKLEQYILRSELKIGQKPKVVLLDYIQLMQTKGTSRYERMSNIAEELKIIAKSTRTIIFVASQIHRKEGEDPEVTIFDAKDSGSIENSSGLLLGAWRDKSDSALLHLKILKNTKGISGIDIQCQFKGESMQIVERDTRNTESYWNK